MLFTIRIQYSHPSDLAFHIVGHTQKEFSVPMHQEASTSVFSDAFISNNMKAIHTRRKSTCGVFYSVTFITMEMNPLPELQQESRRSHKQGVRSNAFTDPVSLHVGQVRWSCERTRLLWQMGSNTQSRAVASRLSRALAAFERFGGKAVS